MGLGVEGSPNYLQPGFLALDCHAEHVSARRTWATVTVSRPGPARISESTTRNPTPSRAKPGPTYSTDLRQRHVDETTAGIC